MTYNWTRNKYKRTWSWLTTVAYMERRISVGIVTYKEQVVTP